MLQQFFAILSISVIAYLFYSYAKAYILVWRFTIRAYSVIELYSVVKVALETDFVREDKVVIYYENKGHKYTLEFSSTNEASIEFEKIIQDALEYYDKIGLTDMTSDDALIALKEEVLRIYSEVRKIRWQKQ